MQQQQSRDQLHGAADGSTLAPRSGHQNAGWQVVRCDAHLLAAAHCSKFARWAPGPSQAQQQGQPWQRVTAGGKLKFPWHLPPSALKHDATNLHTRCCRCAALQGHVVHTGPCGLAWWLWGRVAERRAGLSGSGCKAGLAAVSRPPFPRHTAHSCGRAPKGLGKRRKAAGHRPRALAASRT